MTAPATTQNPNPNAPKNPATITKEDGAVITPPPASVIPPDPSTVITPAPAPASVKKVEPAKTSTDFGQHKHKAETCPNCGSGKVKCVLSERVSKVRMRRYVCQKCGAKWETVQDIPKADLDDED